MGVLEIIGIVIGSAVLVFIIGYVILIIVVSMVMNIF